MKSGRAFRAKTLSKYSRNFQCAFTARSRDFLIFGCLAMKTGSRDSLELTPISLFLLAFYVRDGVEGLEFWVT